MYRTMNLDKIFNFKMK